MKPDKQKPFITIQDYSVSKESFDLFHNAELDLLYTYPQPAADDLSRYYESDDYISHTDGKRSLFEKAYQFVKNRALKMKVGLIKNEAGLTGSLLDIGAGTGDFLIAAAKSGWNCVGIEPNGKASATAIQKGVTLLKDTAELTDKSVDVITMWHVLEHVPDIDAQFKELLRLIKPDGKIIIAVPNFKSYDAAHYGKFWAAYDVPRHLWHFSKTSIAKLATQNHLELQKVLPMKFDAFYVSLLSEKYKTGKMNFISAFLNGLRSNAFGSRKKEYSSHIYVLKPAKSNISLQNEETLQ